MQRVWQKTFELLKKHPVSLWPVLMADILVSGLRYEQRSLGLQIMQWMTSRRSVLGGAAIPTQPSYGKLVVVGGCINILSFYISILLYCIALFVITADVRSFLSKTDAGSPLATKPASRFQGLLRLSMISTVLMLCMGVLCTLVPTNILERMQRLDLARSPFYIPLTILPLYLVSAYALAPIALSILKRVRLIELPKQHRQEGMIVAFVAALAIVAIALLLNLMHAPTLTTAAEHLAFNVGISLIGALPYAVLFVAMAVIATGNTDATESVVELSDFTGVAEEQSRE